jgi:hypothetical protein
MSTKPALILDFLGEIRDAASPCARRPVEREKLQASGRPPTGGALTISCRIEGRARIFDALPD